jgi:hypothetical protein
MSPRSFEYILGKLTSAERPAARDIHVVVMFGRWDMLGDYKSVLSKFGYKNFQRLIWEKDENAFFPQTSSLASGHAQDILVAFYGTAGREAFHFNTDGEDSVLLGLPVRKFPHQTICPCMDGRRLTVKSSQPGLC